MSNPKKMSNIVFIAISLTTVIPVLVTIYLIKPGLFIQNGVVSAVPVIVFITGIIVVLGVSLLVKISNSIAQLTRNAELIARGDLSREIKPVQKLNSEVTGLAESLNLITEQLVLNVDELESKAILLERTNRELESLNSKRSNFVSTATHELRAPLINIKQCVALLLEEGMALGEQQKERLGMIKNNVERLINLITNLLDVSKLESEQMHVEEMDMVVTMGEAVAMIDHWRASKSISLQVKLPGKKIMLFADTERMRQVFTNLLSNAIKYTSPRGKIEITGEFSEKMIPDKEPGKPPQQRKFIDIMVKDTGIGIDEKDMQEIFKRFAKVKHPDFGKSGGYSTGLGLSIVKDILEMHGGLISVHSQVGKGSVFTVSIPLAPHESGPEAG